MPETDSAPVLDDETTAALTLYNEYVDADRERTRREKRIKKAERAKEDAATEVKRLSAKGSAEDKAAAEQAYRDANEAWRKLRDGEEPDPPAQEASGSEDAPAEEAEQPESEPVAAADKAEPEPAADKADEPAADEPDEPEPEPAADKADEPAADEEE